MLPVFVDCMALSGKLAKLAKPSKWKKVSSSMGDTQRDTSDSGSGVGAGGSPIKSAFSAQKRLQLRMQGVTAFLSTSKQSESEPEITPEQQNQMEQAKLEQEQIRRHPCS